MTTSDPIAASEAARAAPGPRGLPLIGNLLDMSRDTLGFLESLARDYGDVSAFRLAAFPTMLVNDPDLIEQVLVKQHERFVRNRLFWRQLRALLGNGLLTSEGAVWQRQRKLSAPAFATQPLQSYTPDMVEMTERMLAGWKDGQVFDLHREMMGLTLRIAARTLLDADIEEDMDEFEEAANWIIEEVSARFTRPVFIPDYVPLPGNIRYRRGVAFFERMVYRIIRAHRDGTAGSRGLLAQLMAARDEAGRPMSDRQLRDEICTLLLAGYETSAINMSWGFHLLGQHRDIQDALAAEVRALAGDRGLTHEDIARLPGVEHAVIEMLRLYPPGWAVGREALEDTVLGGYRVAAGTTLILSPWIIQRDTRYYEQPLEFRPDRWAGDFRRRLPRFAYFPFGGGPRICIGNRFSMMEAILMLATIVRRFDIERLTDRPVTPLPSVTLRPTGGIWVRAHARAEPLV